MVGVIGIGGLAGCPYSPGLSPGVYQKSVNGPGLTNTGGSPYCGLGGLVSASLPSSAPVTWPPPALSGPLQAPFDPFCDAPSTASLSVTPVNPADWQVPAKADPECSACSHQPAPLYYVLRGPVGSVPAVPLCDGGKPALLVPNYQFRSGPGAAGYTFACPGSALYHCFLDWGFDPLSPTYRACARAIIADYCSNGDTNTVSGVPLFLRTGTAAPKSPSWARQPEATWDENGAICITAPRNTYESVKWDAMNTAPAKVLDYINASTHPGCKAKLSANCAPNGKALITSYPSVLRGSVLCDKGLQCGADN
jgi:hypothetical protein